MPCSQSDDNVVPGIANVVCNYPEVGESESHFVQDGWIVRYHWPQRTRHPHIDEQAQSELHAFRIERIEPLMGGGHAPRGRGDVNADHPIALMGFFQEAAALHDVPIRRCAQFGWNDRSDNLEATSRSSRERR